jgi:lipopolysaccharide export system protein LptC
MNAQNPSFPVTFSFLILCILGSYHFLTQMNSQKTPMEETLHAVPDIFATHVTAFYLNQEGKLQTKFETPKMVHYYARNKTEFESPHFLIYNKKDNAPWHVFALHGLAMSGIESIQLWDHVRVHQDQSKQHHELNLTTSSMTLHPEAQTADTQQPVVLIQPGYHVSAVGVHLSLKEEKVDLISNAKGEFTANFLQQPTR